jgi:outer membrane protein OmpA-like peptidoglycan-associated protein
MKSKLILFFGIFCAILNVAKSQSISQILAEKPKRPIQVGDSAPDFILTVGNNSIRSFSVRKMKRITLLHFWNTDEVNAAADKDHLLRLLEHYEKSSFMNATGFEIIAIAVQKNMEKWLSATKQDTLVRLIHGMAPDSLNDLVCRDYSIKQIPSDILVDEGGFVIAINPRFVDIENILDEKKSYQAIKKDLSGTVALSSNKNKVLKNTKISIHNYYGDALGEAYTNDKGEFLIHDLKLNQDIEFRVTNNGNSLADDFVALYNKDGEFVSDAKTTTEAFIFRLPTRVANKLILNDNFGSGQHLVEEIDVIKLLTFSDNGTKLTAKDEKELNILVFDMKKDPVLYMEFFAHTDSKVDEVKAMEITSNQVNAIKDYFLKRGLDLCHITGVAKGNIEMRKLCLGNGDCTEQEHRLNRRVEFWLFKEPKLTE